MRYGLQVTRIASQPPRLIAWRSGQDYILHFIGEDRSISLTQVNELLRHLLRDADGLKGVTANIRFDPDNTFVIEVTVDPARTTGDLIMHYLGDYEPLLLHEFLSYGSDG